MLHFAAQFAHEVFQKDPSDLHRLGVKKMFATVKQFGSFVVHGFHSAQRNFP